MATTCDCILTRIDNHIEPKQIDVSFTSNILDNPPVVVVVPIHTYIDITKYDIVEVQNKQDGKTESTIYDPNEGVINCALRVPSSWKGGETDEFQLKYKDKFTGESAFVTINLLCVQYHDDFAPSALDISISYPYPRELRVNLVPMLAPDTPLSYVDAGPFNVFFIQGVEKSPYSSKEVLVKLPELGDLSQFGLITPIIVELANANAEYDENTKLGIANINISFN